MRVQDTACTRTVCRSRKKAARDRPCSEQRKRMKETEKEQLWEKDENQQERTPSEHREKGKSTRVRMPVLSLALLSLAHFPV